MPIQRKSPVKIMTDNSSAKVSTDEAKSPTVSDIVGQPKIEEKIESTKIQNEPEVQRFTGVRHRFGNGPMNGAKMQTPIQGPTEQVKGYLDIQPEGHGFLRPKFIPSSRDIYISQSQIRRFLLRPGDLVGGLARPPKDTERYYGLLKVEQVNGLAADDSLRRPWFDDLK